METYKITLSGRVQGVGYRFFCLKTARLLDIRGSVRNASNGTVEILASGSESNMSEFIHMLRKGPMFASVTEIDIQPSGQPVAEHDFQIKY